MDRNIKEILFCKENRKYCIYFLFAVLICLFLLYNSPLYHNIPTFDLSVYMNIGRSLNAGKVMYKDIYDTKGPFWYILCSMITKLPADSVYVWFIIDVFTNFLIMCLFDKIINMKKQHPLWVIIVADIFMFSFFIYNMFDKNSEYTVLPIILYIIYKIINSIENDIKLTNKHLCIIGFLISLLWFIKYTHVVTPGLFILYYVIKNKDNIWYNLSSLFSGLLIICGILVIYFAVNGNFIDYIEVQKSVFIGHTDSVQMRTLFAFLKSFLYVYGILLVVALYFRNKYTVLFLINVLIMLCIYRVTYYYIPLYCYIPIFICEIIDVDRKHILLVTGCFIILLFNVICAATCLFVRRLDKNYVTAYNFIKDYDSVYVINFPQYYYLKNIDMPYYFDYEADASKVVADLYELDNNMSYRYIYMPVDFWPELEHYEFCGDSNGLGLYQRKE